LFWGPLLCTGYFSVFEKRGAKETHGTSVHISLDKDKGAYVNLITVGGRFAENISPTKILKNVFLSLVSSKKKALIIIKRPKRIWFDFKGNYNACDNDKKKNYSY